MNSVLTTYSNWAIKALLYEVALTPKPGLVDRWNNGAHHDMDFYTFIDSCMALHPFFYAYIQLGWHHQGSPIQLFEQLRQKGIEAEAAMLRATKGINTHKGANFSFAILLGATGYYLAQCADPIQPLSPEVIQEIAHYAQLMAQHLPQDDLANLHTKTHLTHGEQLYIQYGIQGPRGEAAAGYPSLIQTALPYLRQQIKYQHQTDFALLNTLVYLMATLEDGNLIHRGGIQAWQTVKADMTKLHDANFTATELVQQLTDYNTVLVDQHLSPGGSADLLALTIFFAFAEGILS